MRRQVFARQAGAGSPADLTIGRNELPELISEQLPGSLRILVQLDPMPPVETVAG